MKKRYIFFIGFLLAMFILNIFKKPLVWYLPVDFPGKQMAATIPPFGIFIEKEYKNEDDAPGSILSHEKIHWNQYQRMGLIKFYYAYVSEYIKHGRIHNWMEEEARRLSR